MNRYEINVEIGTKPNGKPDRRRLYENAKNDHEAEIQAAKRVSVYGPKAEIISVYLTV